MCIEEVEVIVDPETGQETITIRREEDTDGRTNAARRKLWQIM